MRNVLALGLATLAVGAQAVGATASFCPTNKYDVVFIQDLTGDSSSNVNGNDKYGFGDMQMYGKMIGQQAYTFMNKINDKDVQVSIVSYYDDQINVVKANVRDNFSNDLVNGHPVSGTSREPTLEVLRKLASNQSPITYRSDATKVFILISNDDSDLPYSEVIPGQAAAALDGYEPAWTGDSALNNNGFPYRTSTAIPTLHPLFADEVELTAQQLVASNVLLFAGVVGDGTGDYNDAKVRPNSHYDRANPYFTDVTSQPDQHGQGKGYQYQYSDPFDRTFSHVGTLQFGNPRFGLANPLIPQDFNATLAYEQHISNNHGSSLFAKMYELGGIARVLPMEYIVEDSGTTVRDYDGHTLPASQFMDNYLEAIAEGIHGCPSSAPAPAPIETVTTSSTTVAEVTTSESATVSVTVLSTTTKAETTTKSDFTTTVVVESETSSVLETAFVTESVGTTTDVTDVAFTTLVESTGVSETATSVYEVDVTLATTTSVPYVSTTEIVSTTYTPVATKDVSTTKTEITTTLVIESETTSLFHTETTTALVGTSTDVTDVDFSTLVVSTEESTTATSIYEVDVSIATTTSVPYVSTTETVSTTVHPTETVSTSVIVTSTTVEASKVSTTATATATATTVVSEIAVASVTDVATSTQTAVSTVVATSVTSSTAAAGKKGGLSPGAIGGISAAAVGASVAGAAAAFVYFGGSGTVSAASAAFTPTTTTEAFNPVFQNAQGFSPNPLYDGPAEVNHL